MDTTQKVFKIEPSFFNYSKTKKNRNTKIPKIPKIPFKPKEKKIETIKKKNQLLKQIRQIQEKQFKEINKPSSTPGLNNTIETKPTENINTTENSNFNDAFKFLTQFSNENTPSQPAIPSHINSSINSNKTLKKYTPPFSLTPLTEQRPLYNNILPQTSTQFTHTPNTHIMPRPQYGCLKNGNLPTYRSWNNTRKNYTGIPQKLNLGGISQPQPQFQPQKLNLGGNGVMPHTPQNLKHTQISKVSNLHKQNTENKKIKTPKKQQKTLRRIHRVGKNGRKIAVLISNKTIRKNISTKEMLLKQTPIPEMKQYLLKKGFIKVGSGAPNEILRKMFITTQLMCGEIQNHNSENLLYNYLHNTS
jgi:hypothetical protein